MLELAAETLRRTRHRNQRSSRIAKDPDQFAIAFERVVAGSDKSDFMLSDAERKVLNSALEKYRPSQSEPILVGGREVLKPALRLMTSYRLAIEEIKDVGIFHPPVGIIS